jgi:hypothetical protein
MITLKSKSYRLRERGTGVAPAAQAPPLHDSARPAEHHFNARSVVHFSTPETGALSAPLDQAAASDPDGGRAAPLR